MQPDPIVEEVRKVRQAHAATFNYNKKAIFDDLKKKEKTCGHQVVSRSPRLLLKKTGS